MNTCTDYGGGDAGGKVAIANQPNTGAGGTNIGNQLFVARAIENNYYQIFHIAFEPSCDVLQIVGHGRVEFDGIFAGGSDDDFLHVAVGSVEQTSALGSSQHGDGSGGAGGAQVGAFERIDRDVDLWHIASIREVGADFFADVEHWRFIAFALADHNCAAHGNAFHSPAHGLG